MPITDLLERNSKLYGDEIALVEINPEVREEQRVSWQEYELIQPTGDAPYLTSTGECMSPNGTPLRNILNIPSS